MENSLWFGDNLHVLREHVKDESVDLIYLDPPFKSDANYNVLFKSPVGELSEAQAHAFKDTWRWGEEAELALDDVRERSPDTFRLLKAIKEFLGHSDVMAYLAMMAARLIELRRVLRPSGSLYLHCDPTASHYLKVLLDGVFGAENFRTEITWKRTTSHGNVSRNYGDVTDRILFYTKSASYTWNQKYVPFDDAYIEEKFRGKDPDGRRWQSVTLRNPSQRPNLRFSYKASNGKTYQPHPNGWACDIKRLQQYDREDRLHFPAKSTGQLRLKMYLDESPGVRLQSLWTDIPALNSQARERLGYPTQKPLALLERIVEVSSNPGDVVLDPFCGCGTTIHAAEKLSRKWIGIDITHLAIQIIEDRLKTWLRTARYQVRGIPKTEAEARALATRDPYQFQLWAVSRLDGQPRGRGADRGIDGEIIFKISSRDYGRAIVSVKAGRNISPGMVRDLIGTVANEDAMAGVFVCVDQPTAEMKIAAASAGIISTDSGKSPRIQIVTVKDLIAGAKLKLGVTLNTIAAAQATKIKPKAPKQPKPEEPQFIFTVQGGKGKSGVHPIASGRVRVGSAFRASSKATFLEAAEEAAVYVAENVVPNKRGQNSKTAAKAKSSRR